MAPTTLLKLARYFYGIPRGRRL